LDDAQIRALITFKPKTFRQSRVHLGALLILDSGLRVSEMLHLRNGDVDCDNLILKVFGKGQKERLVPFSPELRRRLYRYHQLRAKKGIKSEFLFAGFEGSRWEKRNSTTSLYLLQDKLGLPRFGWHRLRHVRNQLPPSRWRRRSAVDGAGSHADHDDSALPDLLTEDLSASHQRVSILNRLG